MVVIDVKGIHEWQMITKGYDDMANSVKDKRITKRVMTWHVWWCGMCDEVGKTYDGVLMSHEVIVTLW